MTEEPIAHIGFRLACAAMRFVKDSGGRALMDQVHTHLLENSDIPEHAKGKWDSQNIPIWDSSMRYAATKLQTAGFMERKKGVWSITQAGEKVLEAKSDDEIAEEANRIYRAHRKARKGGKAAQTDEEKEMKESSDDGELEISRAKRQILQKIQSKSADSEYAEKLTAELFYAMGYDVEKTRRGPDGGIDVVATGQLGTTGIVVQVKNHAQPIGQKDVRELVGVLASKSDNFTGVFVSFSGFRKGCKEFAESSKRYVKLVYGEDFIDLWCQYYDKLPNTGKMLLPLKSVYFLDEERAKRS